MPSSVTPHQPLSLPSLNLEDRAAPGDLYVLGTPENTLRTYERDPVYVTAWEQAAFGAALNWSDLERVALRVILDHPFCSSSHGGRCRGIDPLAHFFFEESVVAIGEAARGFNGHAGFLSSYLAIP